MSQAGLFAGMAGRWCTADVMLLTDRPGEFLPLSPFHVKMYNVQVLCEYVCQFLNIVTISGVS